MARVLLWIVALLAPGGLLLVPVLAAQSIASRRRGHAGAPLLPR